MLSLFKMLFLRLQVLVQRGMRHAEPRITILHIYHTHVYDTFLNK